RTARCACAPSAPPTRAAGRSACPPAPPRSWTSRSPRSSGHASRSSSARPGATSPRRAPTPLRRSADMDIDMGALRALERERDISLPVLLDAIRRALHAAYLHTDHPVKDSEVVIDERTGAVTVLA